MRKISILVLLFAFAINAQAQREKKRMTSKLTSEQQATLAVKKMTLALDLSEAQQKKILPLLEQQADYRKEGAKMIKEKRQNETRPTPEERFELQNKQLDRKIEFKENMKVILTEDQFKRFEKMMMAKRMKDNKRRQQMRKNRKEW